VGCIYPSVASSSLCAIEHISSQPSIFLIAWPILSTRSFQLPGSRAKSYHEVYFHIRRRGGFSHIGRFCWREEAPEWQP
jgi:hypothetical protein